MPARRQRATSPRYATSAASALKLAIYFKSPDVERHVAPLRRSRRVRLSVELQNQQRTPPRDASGILWELAPENGTDRRRLAALLGRAPAASYGATPDRRLADLSRTLGFAHHLAAPLRLAEVEHALGLPGEIDLADRLENAGPRLVKIGKRLVARPTTSVGTRPKVDVAALVDEERSRWP